MPASRKARMRSFTMFSVPSRLLFSTSSSGTRAVASSLRPSTQRR
jgi:hypothetical protein